MTNPNDILFNGAVRRRIAIERYSDARARETLKFLEELRKNVVAKIAGAGDPRSYSVRQQRELLRSIDDLHNEIYAKVNTVLDSDFARMAAQQAAYEGTALKAATGATVRELSATAAYEAAKARPMQGRFLKDWLTDLSPTHKRRLEAELRMIFIEREPLNRAISRIGSAVNLSKNGLKALIRTSNSHISSAVSEATYKANNDIIEEYEWRSTLDMRTTPICQMRDGQRFKVGDGPMPPAHVSCRSTTTVILKGFPPPERVTYKQWLKGQSPDIQDEVLGKRRGADYRAGRINPDSYVSPDGRLKGAINRAAPVRTAARPATPATPKAPKTLKEAQRIARDDVIAHGLKTGNEKLTMIDEETLIATSANGKKSEATIPRSLWGAVDDPKRKLVAHHNHPSSTSLSPADVAVAHNPGITGVWAHGHNGSDYFVKALDKTPAGFVRVQKEVARIHRIVSQALQEAVNRGEISGKDATYTRGHIVMTVLKNRKLVEYQATLRGPSLEMWERNKDAFNAIIKAMGMYGT